jgi:hypothetical protein
VLSARDFITASLGNFEESAINEKDNIPPSKSPSSRSITFLIGYFLASLNSQATASKAVQFLIQQFDIKVPHTLDPHGKELISFLCAEFWNFKEKRTTPTPDMFSNSAFPPSVFPLSLSLPHTASSGDVASKPKKMGENWLRVMAACAVTDRFRGRRETKHTASVHVDDF